MELAALLRCPTCRGKLDPEPQALRCVACQRSFELIHGIPDLRSLPPDAPRHGEFCLEVIRRWPTSSYADLWALFHQDAPDALRTIWRDHEEQAPQRGERRWDEILRHAAAARRPLPSGPSQLPAAAPPPPSADWRLSSPPCRLPSADCRLPSAGGRQPTESALDIGCGAGSALFALARRFRLAIGLDILLSDLLLAKKRFAEAGIANAAFVCASALELPLADDAFDLLNATDVIEHIGEPARFLAEARRVLRPGGVFFFNSPNRFSLLTPEPHVKLWWVGWLPRGWAEPYVRWRLGKPYRGKRLLSLGELRRSLRSTFGAGSFAIRSFAPRGRLARALTRPIEALARPILPQHNALAWK